MDPAEIRLIRYSYRYVFIKERGVEVYNCQLRSKAPISKKRRRSSTLKGSQRMRGGQNLHASPLNKDLSNETTFCLIHLAGQYCTLPKNL
jgi:hypothetical protein